MTLAIILTVLLIDRMLWHDDALREHRWYARYTDRVLGTATGRWLSGVTLGAFWFLLPPLLAVAFLQSLDADILELAIGIAVLLFALGPQDLGRVSDAFLTARDRGHDSEASRLAATLSGGGEQPEDEPARSLAVATGLLEQSCQRLFGPLLWFVLLGPLGAALYRLAALTVEQASRHEQASPNLAGSAQQLLALLDWLPARLTTAAFAAAGNFDAVSHAWREHTGPVDQKSDAETLLSAAGRAALGSWPDEEEIGAGEQPPVVEDAMALIWRSLVVGLLVLAAGSLFAVLL